MNLILLKTFVIEIADLAQIQVRFFQFASPTFSLKPEKSSNKKAASLNSPDSGDQQSTT
jgi:hypothetical protein